MAGEIVQMAWVSTIVVVVLMVLAPPSLITKCSDPEYRQTHLAECNSSQPPPIGGGPRRSGLFGLGIGGIL